MQTLEHPVEKLRLALHSSRKDLIQIYEKYSREEQRLLEEGLLPHSPLFHPITVHCDSDWIPSHPEAAQDFQSFYSNPYRSTPNNGHKTIYIQTIGSFGDGDAITERYVEWLRGYCQAFYYGLVVKVLPPVTVASTGCTFRVNSNTKNLQLHAGELLNFLKKKKPKDAFCIVGITMIDLYPKDSWNFVFGQASLTEGMGVFSFARYDDDFYRRNYAGRIMKGIKLKPGDYSIFQGYYTPPVTSMLLFRSCKTLTHEIGHIFGVKHCLWLQCVMQGSNHLEESDRRPPDVCPICLRKLQSAIGFKIADRYKALLHWIDDGASTSGHGFAKPTQAFQDFREWLYLDHRMAEAGFCGLLLFCSLFSGLLFYINSCLENGNMTKMGERANFIIILADDIGWGDLWTKETESSTPWLNMLKLEGKRFTDFHSPASTCSPSRAALLTGRHGLRNGVTHNFAVGSVGGLPLNETTFAQLLQDAGYYTAMIGKWHLGHNGPYNPIHRGFDYYLGIPYSNDMGCTDQPGFDLPSCPPCEQSKHSSRKHGECDPKLALPLFENQTIVEQPLNLWDLTGQYAKAAVKQILTASNRGQPFLLYVALAHMHVPLFQYGFLNISEKNAFSASLSDMDSLVGSIKLAAEAFSVNNTVIWFTGDNGPWEQKCQFAGSTGPFVGRWQTSRGGGSAKRTTWEGGHRVPTVVTWPGKIPPNTTSNALLSGMDIFPTILSLAGIQPPSDRRYDGIDITDILLHHSDTGHKSLMHPNSGAAGEFGELQTVRLGRHKAFYITGGAEACGGGSGKPEIHDPPLIFDLAKDEAEESALDPSSEEYQTVLKQVEKEQEALLWDIATDNVSTADYSITQSAVPCCQPQNPACRCFTLR